MFVVIIGLYIRVMSMCFTVGTALIFALLLTPVIYKAFYLRFVRQKKVFAFVLVFGPKKR